MKKSVFILVAVHLALVSVGLSALPGEARQQTYEVVFREDIPDSVEMWSHSSLVQDKSLRESRFSDYSTKAADSLVLDATAGRDVRKSDSAHTRETAFYMAYDERGLHLYIEAKEPLIKEALDASIDPRSPANKEAFEIFISPGLTEVPYYQFFVNPLNEKATVFDWGSPFRHYRSLGPYFKVESRPLADGFGTYLFIPWEGIYERIPINETTWRFTIIRWMPFAKAGGVTWGGRVHQTGDFGLLHFKGATPDQRTRIEGRLARKAWYKFLATSGEATRFWDDEKLGDPVFYKTSLKPRIDELTRLGNSFGPPGDWSPEVVVEAGKHLEEWFEFDYEISELRTNYLENQFFGTQAQLEASPQ